MNSDHADRSDEILEKIRRLHWVGIYTRQSRGPRDAYSSCQAQFDACRALVSAKYEDGWVFNGRRYDDEAESSETLERPGLQRLLQHIREGKVQRVVIHRVDRLSRRLVDCAKILQELQDRHVPLSIVKQPDVGGSAAGTLLLNLLASFAEFEQQLTRERLSDARAALKRRGRRVAGVVPYGYKADPISKQLVIVRTEAQRIQKMFEMAVGGKKPSEIAALANQRRWLTKERQSRQGNVSGGGKWTARQVLAVLSNPVYVGLIRDRDRMRHGAHEPIIDQRSFDAVRQSIASRRTSPRDRVVSRVDWPLRGILRCGQCGRLLTPSISGHKNLQYRYYRCRSDAGGKPACRGVSLPAYEIETFVLQMVGGVEFHASQRGAESALDGALQNFHGTWQSLSLQVQSKLLSRLVREVVYDVRRSKIQVTIDPQAVEEFMQAPPAET